jgi:hypothetical protein
MVSSSTMPEFFSDESQSAFKEQRVTMEPGDLLGSLPVFVHLTLRPALHTGVQSEDLDVFSLIPTIQCPVPTGFWKSNAQLMALSDQRAFWNGLPSQQHGWIISSGLTVMDRQQLFFKQRECLRLHDPSSTRRPYVPVNADVVIWLPLGSEHRR